MPDPDVIRKTSAVNSDCGLKLSGDKIKLETRPVNKESTASSRCALLGRGYSRPLSAVPVLSLYRKDDFEVDIKTKRPFSADHLPLNSKRKLKRIDLLSNLQDVEDSSSSDGNDLPSSELLKTLISQPIQSHRSYSKQADYVQEDLSSSEESLGTRTVGEQNEDFVRDQLCLLTPGLKTKPPLPKKIERKFDADELKIDIQEDDSNARGNNLLRIDEIEEIRRKSLKFDDEFPLRFNRGNFDQNSVACQRQEIMSEKEFDEYLETTEENGRDYYLDRYEEIYSEGKLLNSLISKEDPKCLANHDDVVPEIKLTGSESEIANKKVLSDRLFGEAVEEKLPTSKSDNELNFKIWANEDIFATQSERRTDSFFKDLKSQHEKIDRCINKAQKVLDKTKNYQNVDNENCGDEADFESIQNYKFNKFFEIDDANKQTVKQCQKIVDNSSAHQVKKRTKIVKKTVSTRQNFVAEETMKLKPKFIAKPMRSFRDYSEKGLGEEESWMTKELANKNLTPTIDEENHSDRKDDQKVNGWMEPEARQGNYLEVLDNIEDLERAIGTRSKDDGLNEIPEHDSNTYDDIAQILDVLEAEDRKSQKKMESMKEIVNNDLVPNKMSYSKQKEIEESNFKPLRSNSVASKASDDERVSTASLNSSASNYNEILSFLDEVDRNCTKSLVCAKERVNKVTQFLEKAICLDTIPKKEDLQVLTSDELSDQIVNMNIRLKEKSSSIKVLQDELSSLREQIVKTNRKTEEIVRQKLKSQKDEHEAVIKRHQKFIDQLIADKKTLNQQCEGLISEMKVLEDRYKSNVKAAEHRHHVELQKVKEMHVAGEKIRRDRWIDSKTQKIKELTVKSIEPELQNMAVRQQQEISDLRALQKRELEDLELKAARKTQQQCEALREQLVEEREKALAHEREIMRQRYEKLVECEEKGYQEQRRRLLQEHGNRIGECEEREAAAVVERDRIVKQVRDEFEEKLQASNRRHSNEMKMLKEATDLEMEAWKNNYRKQQAVQLSEKETKIRENCRKERDREIEVVIERLEAESDETRRQIEQATENRVRRMKEKFDGEIRDLELSEKETKSKYSETKSGLLECEDVIISLKATIKQLETQLRDCREISEQLTTERAKMKKIVRDEMKGEIEVLEREIWQSKSEKDKELQQVYSRVKMAVARKDEILSELTRDHTALQEKCAYLENMLEQQRKEYLIK